MSQERRPEPDSSKPPTAGQAKNRASANTYALLGSWQVLTRQAPRPLPPFQPAVPHRPRRRRGVSDGDPGVDLGQVETERALGPGTDETDRPQLRLADLALDLGLRLMTRRAFMNRGTCREASEFHMSRTLSRCPRSDCAVLHTGSVPRRKGPHLGRVEDALWLAIVHV